MGSQEGGKTFWQGGVGGRWEGVPMKISTTSAGKWQQTKQNNFTECVTVLEFL